MKDRVYKFSKMTQQLIQFHDTFGHGIGTKPNILTGRVCDSRIHMIREEVDEFEAACAEMNGPEMLDALGDIVYLCFGTAVCMGIDLTKVVDAIHESNMTKLGADGKPILNRPGMDHFDPTKAPDKILKGPNYVPPTEKIVEIWIDSWPARNAENAK